MLGGNDIFYRRDSGDRSGNGGKGKDIERFSKSRKDILSANSLSVIR